MQQSATQGTARERPLWESGSRLFSPWFIDQDGLFSAFDFVGSVRDKKQRIAAM
jgi:hypothetical protein